MNPDGKLEIRAVSAGPFLTNTYLMIWGKEAILLDPGTAAGDIASDLRLSSIRVAFIVSTHGHFDHMVDVDSLRKLTGAKFLLGNGEDHVLEWSYSVAGDYLGRELERVEPDRLLSDGDRIPFGGHEAEIISLPGHTPGSIGILAENHFITGDTLFKGTIGRTDLGGSMEDMNRTLRKISKMDPALEVLPGHGPGSTLREELDSNPFLMGIMGED